MGKGWIPAEGKLDLEDEGRTEWPAAEIAAAGPENIRVLDLDGNKLTAIPGEQLARLTALEKLRLYNNQLTAIPAELARLSALEVLNVCNNQLTAIPAEVGRLSALQLLDVSSNRLTAIPAEVGHLPLLTSFYAMGNPLTDLPASARVSNGAVLAYLRSLPPPAAAAVSAPAQPPPPRPAARPPPAPAYAPPTHAPPPRPAPPQSPAASAAPTGDPRRWSEAQVVAWVQSLGALAEFAPCFRFTNGHALLALDEAKLERLGVGPWAACHALHANIGVLAAQSGVARMELAAVPMHPPPARPAADGKSWDCFISYAHEDAALVFRYCDTLEAAGLKIWVDKELKSGQKWMVEIGDAMGKCRAYICFLSPAYIRSKNCDDEMQYAHHQLRVPKFPVWLVDPKSVELPTDYRMMLTSVNWTQQRGAGAGAADEAARALVAGLRAFLRSAPAAAPEPPKKEDSGCSLS